MALPEISPRPAARAFSDTVAFGQEIIATEAAALTALRDSLDSSFSDAVSLLLGLRGRVVVTGIGKSGHVARKVAATLASTGTPALFLHPAEAAHGDLGMLLAGDGLLVFSNSGSSVELQPILIHAATHRIPIIGIAAKPKSLLMRRAKVELLLPTVEEACPENLAPTTSTSMMMALGDALAMATMRIRGVSRAGFEALHPGGAIGKKLMRVTAVMHPGDQMPLVSAAMPMREVIPTMTKMSFGMAGVVDADRRLVGVITDGDLRRHLNDLLHSTASDVMTPDPVTMSAAGFVSEALTLLNKHKITALFVTDESDPQCPVGIVHVHDFLRLGLS